MIAPTPVSALVHSSTLVTAGVYLIYRFVPIPSDLLIFVGIFTTLISGLAAIFERDIKKIIALSTLRQLGLIVSCLGCGERSICFAHLNTHAAFKALIFLGVGTVIHCSYGSQETRSIGGVCSSSPSILIVLATACLSMCGLVFLSGWVTKEAILEACVSNNYSVSILILFYLGIGLTLGYRLSLLRLIFFSHAFNSRLSCSFSPSRLLKLPMFMLLILSLFQGYIFNLNCFFSPSFLCLEDKFLVWGVLIVTVAIILPLLSLRFGSSFIYGDLGRSSYFFCSATKPASSLVFTEVSALQGGGLARLSCLVTRLSVGTNILSKVLVLLFLTFLVT